MVFLAVSVHADAAKMSSYTDNTTPNEHVYFVGVDPNDTTQTVNGSNYRYSINSIMGLGLIDAVFKSISATGTGDSWLELNNNTTFTDSLTGKYGLRFYNGVLQQIINGTVSSIGSGGYAPTIQANDPTIGSTTGWYLAQTSGDLFYVNYGIEMFTITGTRTADETAPVIAAGTDGTHDGSTAVSATAVLTELYRVTQAMTYSAINATPASGSMTGTYPNYSVSLTPTNTSDIVVTYAASDLAGNPAVGTDLIQNFVYAPGTTTTCIGWDSPSCSLTTVPASSYATGTATVGTEWTATEDGTATSINVYLTDTSSGHVSLYKNITGTITLLGKGAVTKTGAGFSGDIPLVAEGGQSLTFLTNDELYYTYSFTSQAGYVGREDAGGTGMYYSTTGGAPSTITFSTSAGRKMAIGFKYEN